MKTNNPNGFSEENLVMFPAAKNFKIPKVTHDPLEELLMEFSHLENEEYPDYLDDRFLEDDLWNEEETAFHSLDAFMNRKQIGDVAHPDDRLIKVINERIDAIKEAKERIKFYLEEIEMFMPKRR